MAMIIDMMTRKKWTMPKPRQLATVRTDTAAGRYEFRPIGQIADEIVRKLAR